MKLKYKRILHKSIYGLMAFVTFFLSVDFFSIKVFAGAPQIDPNLFTEEPLWKVLEGGVGSSAGVVDATSIVNDILFSEFGAVALSEGAYYVDENIVTPYYEETKQDYINKVKQGEYASGTVYLYNGVPYALTDGFWGVNATALDNESYQGFLSNPANKPIDIDTMTDSVKNAYYQACYSYQYGITKLEDLVQNKKNWVVEFAENFDLKEYIKEVFNVEHKGINFDYYYGCSCIDRWGVRVDRVWEVGIDTVNGYTNISEVAYDDGWYHFFLIGRDLNGKYVQLGWDDFNYSYYGASSVIPKSNFPIIKGKTVENCLNDLNNGTMDIKDTIKNHIFVNPSVAPSVIGGNRYNLGDIQGTNISTQEDVALKIDEGVDLVKDPSKLPDYKPIPIEIPTPDIIKQPDKIPEYEPADNPDDNPSGNPDDNPSGNPDDNPSGNPDDNPSGNPDDNPSSNPEDIPDIKQEDFELHDLRNFFPFCIPFDLYDCFMLLKADPEEPIWDIPIQIIKNSSGSGYLVDTHLVIDLTKYNLPMVFKVIRTLEILGFIIFLGFVTKNFIF